MPPLKSSLIKPSKSMLFFHIWNANFSVTPINSQMYMTKPKQVQKKLSENTGKTFSVIMPPFTSRGWAYLRKLLYTAFPVYTSYTMACMPIYKMVERYCNMASGAAGSRNGMDGRGSYSLDCYNNEQSGWRRSFHISAIMPWSWRHQSSNAIFYTIFKLQIASPPNGQTILDISILLKCKDVREKNRKTALRTLNRAHAV